MHLGTRPESLPDDLRLANLARVREAVQGALIHDLKGPLNAATLELDLLRQTLLKAEDTEQLRESGLQTVEALRRELSRLNEELGSLAPLPENAGAEDGHLDPAALIVEAARLTRQKAIVRGVRLELPHPGEPAETRGRRVPLLQAMLAVLLNAIEACPAGGTVRISADREGPAFRITLEDAGEGFGPEALERAFDPHYSEKGHPGLGLTVARGILEEHGGTLMIGNSPTGGLVELSLPIAPAGEED